MVLMDKLKSPGIGLVQSTMISKRVHAHYPRILGVNNVSNHPTIRTKESCPIIHGYLQCGGVDEQGLM